MVTSRTAPESSPHRVSASHSVPRVTAGLSAGVLAVSVGAGLGVRHLLLEGPTFATVVGLSILVAGLLLVGGATHRLWQSLRGRRRLWFLPGVPLVLVATWSLMFAVMVTVVPSTALDRPRLTSLGVASRDVTMLTADGVLLSATWAPSTNGAAIVLLHGAGENRSSTAPAASVLARHGYGVLLLDARGHGQSAGPGMDLGWFGDSDLAAAISFLRNDGTVDPSRIGVLGLSMGGEEAIGAAAAMPEIRAVVAEGATSRTAEDKSAWLPDGVAGAVQRVIDRITYGLVDLLTSAGPPIALRNAVTQAEHAEVLLIAAGTSPDEQSAAEVIRSAAPDRVDVWTVAGGTHTSGLRTAPAQWERRVITFLDETLAKP